MEKNEENYIEKFESYFEKANSNLKYSIDKFDTMILSISCGGLIFSMGFLKYLLLDKKEIDWLNSYHSEVYEKLSPFLIEEEKLWLKEKTAAICPPAP